MVCNGAEGEPATFKDRAIMQANPYAVVEGVAIAAFAVGAERAFIGVKERFGPSAERLAAAVDQMMAAGLLGDLTVQVVLGPDHYLFGEETGLLQVIEGEAPLPRLVPPYIEGLFATVPSSGWSAPPSGVATEFAASNPTVVNNVETLATVAQVLARGRSGTGRSAPSAPPGSWWPPSWATWCGPAWARSSWAPRCARSSSGSAAALGRSIKAVVPGAANPVITAGALDAPAATRAWRRWARAWAPPGSWCWTTPPRCWRWPRVFSRFLYVESCGQCPACKLGCGAVTDGLDRLAAAEATPEDVETIAYRLRTVTDGNRCYLPVQEHGWWAASSPPASTR